MKTHEKVGLVFMFWGGLAILANTDSPLTAIIFLAIGSFLFAINFE